MTQQISKRKRIFRGIGIGFAVLVVLVYLGLPAAMGVSAVLSNRAAVGEPPAGFEEALLHTADGLELRAWYHPPANGAVILLLHGAGGSRTGVRSYAELLAGHGYGVLAFDLRGHGQSQGQTNRLGWQGTADIGAALDFLRQRAEVRQIGGLGISMGGEALLGAAAAYPEVRAMAADGATRRCTAELLALESERPLVRNFTARVMYATVQLLSGEQPPTPLLTSMLAADQTQFLFIAGGGNALEVAFNELFASRLGERAELWVAPGAAHTAAFLLYPQEYGQRLTAFFDRVLLEE